MPAVGFELRQAARRVFTWRQTGAVLIPAIGLALAAIMFAVGWGYSPLSLPFKDADRLVSVSYENAWNDPDLQGLYKPFLEWKERGDVFTDVAAERAPINPVTVNTGSGSVMLVPGEVTANFFDTLGVSFPGIQAWKESVNISYPLPLVLIIKPVSITSDMSLLESCFRCGKAALAW
jgi:hypothetical protein